MLIDINTSLGHWPFGPFRQDSAAQLAAHLRSEGISTALVSSIDAALYPDVNECNRRLLAEVQSHSELVPLLTVNPALPGWEEMLDAGQIPAVRVVPGYHNLDIDGEAMRRLAGRLNATDRVLLVQVRLEDERSHHPLCRIPPVGKEGLQSLAHAFPSLPIVCLCPYLGVAVEWAGNCANVHFDLSMVEQLDTVNAVLERVAAEQILFGSHTPFLYTRSAVMKLNACSAAADAVDKIACGNARRLFGLGAG